MALRSQLALHQNDSHGIGTQVAGSLESELCSAITFNLYPVSDLLKLPFVTEPSSLPLSATSSTWNALLSHVPWAHVQMQTAATQDASIFQVYSSTRSIKRSASYPSGTAILHLDRKPQAADVTTTEISGMYQLLSGWRWQRTYQTFLAGGPILSNASDLISSVSPSTTT